MTDVQIDMSQLREFGRVLHRLAPELEKEFRNGLAAAGEIIAAAARRKAGEFSTRIPATVKVRRRGNRVRVVAGGPGAPGAAAINNKGLTGIFRHPVFGNREVWVDQPARPFLEPDDATSEEAVVAVLGVVDTTFGRLGL